ncbi:MAG: hypothetical protein KFH98_12020 [Gemmatimonadetes bacterium]|nr:hypothetical protein [Gemmatimonadota bacterium]
MRLRWCAAGALAVGGAALGVLGAWILSRVLSGMVYGVTVRDPVAFVAAPVVLLMVRRSLSGSASCTTMRFG